MTDDRIKAAAEWAKARSAAWQKPGELRASNDAAHILSLLADGKAVLCEENPALYDDCLWILLDPWSTDTPSTAD